MKLSPNSRFAHPVLSLDTSDYPGASYEVVLDHEEDPAKGLLTLICRHTIACPPIEELLKNGLLAQSLLVGCQETYYREIHDIGASGRLELPLDALFGRVELTPLLTATVDIGSYKNDQLSKEFQTPLAFRKGDILGYAPMVALSIGRLKLERFDSIFQLAEDPTLPEGEIAVDLDSEKIQILANPVLKQVIDGLRLNTSGQSMLLSTVYLPAVMEVLANLAGDASAWNGKRWKEVFAAKCDQLNIKLERGDELLRNAQRLLHYPVTITLTSASGEDD